MTKSSELKNLKIALMNEDLHKRHMSPRNHDVEYHRGWYYVDSQGVQRPDLTKKAERLYSQGIRARHSREANTYFVDYE